MEGPDIVAPFAGDVTATVGAMVSGGGIVGRAWNLYEFAYRGHAGTIQYMDKIITRRRQLVIDWSCHCHAGTSSALNLKPDQPLVAVIVMCSS